MPGSCLSVDTVPGQPQRVLMVIDHLDIGGAQRHVSLLAQGLAERSHEVHLVHTGRPSVDVDPRVHVRCLMSGRVARREEPLLDTRLVEYAVETRPTVIHAHLYASALAGAHASSRLGTPLVLSHHSAGTWQGSADRALLRSALKQASHHFTASPQIKAALHEQGVPAGLVEFLPNAIHVPAPPPERSPGTDMLVGFLGRFDPDKNPRLALAVMGHASGLGSRARLEMRGSGPLLAEVRKAAGREGLKGRVRIAGSVQDVDSFFRRIDVLLLTSNSEGMPLAILEAMAHELPVVATRVGAVPLEVLDGVTGLLAEPGDAVGLGKAVAWLEAHPEERRRMGRRGRRRLQRHFFVEGMVARVGAVYERVTRARSLHGHGATRWMAG